METAGELLPHIRPWLSLWLYAVGASERLRVGDEGRKARWGDGFAPDLSLSQLEVQAQEEGKGVFLLIHPVGGADGGVEGGLGVAEAVGAGGFEGAIEIAQGPAVGGHDLAAQGAQGNGGFGDRSDLGECGRLRPGEGVEDGVGCIAEALREGRTLGCEPCPVEAGLQDAE